MTSRILKTEIEYCGQCTKPRVLNDKNYSCGLTNLLITTGVKKDWVSLNELPSIKIPVWCPLEKVK